MTPEEREEFNKKMSEFSNQHKNLIDEFLKSVPKFELPDFTFPLPNIDLPVFPMPKIEIPSFIPPNFDFSMFQIPNITFPKFEFPEIDYERLEDITNDNSKYGWTLTGEMSLGDYFEDELISLSHEQKDEYFHTYYSKNDWEHYKNMKGLVIDNIEPRWTELIQDCFDSFENDKFRLVIPTLFTIIEGEMSFAFQSHQGSNDLIQLVDKKAKNEKSKLMQISLYSVVSSMKKQLFLSHKFYDDRNGLINRQWILHGRDDPNHWQKVDALRLFNVLSSLQFIKDNLQET